MTGKVITAYFEADHDRLESLFKQYQALKHADFDKAKAYFKAFITGLKRHIVWEEDVLFPLFESKSGMSQTGPTFVMREEHRKIAQILEAIHDKVRSKKPGIDADENSLLQVLSQHNQKEEQILYPAIDNMISSEEAAGIFLGMDQVPAGRYEHCCNT